MWCRFRNRHSSPAAAVTEERLEVDETKENKWYFVESDHPFLLFGDEDRTLLCISCVSCLSQKTMYIMNVRKDKILIFYGVPTVQTSSL
jgi:hypothetical protein